jgi:hypothetical protein
MKMKTMLLILMFLASAASAKAMSDAEMKALLVGTWNEDVGGATSTFTADGRWIYTDPTLPAIPIPSVLGQIYITGYNNDRYWWDVDHWWDTEHWDIKDGELIEIRTPAASRPYRILFLTEHECILHWGHHGGGYTWWSR